MLIVTKSIQIPLNEFEFTFARSSGPGGQNVNKVNSKALLRWNPSNSAGMLDDVKGRFFARYENQLTLEGELLITSDRFRDQVKNKEDCLNKLREMILLIAVPPKPRKKTKPSRSAKKKRFESKKKHGEKKQGRQKPRF